MIATKGRSKKMIQVAPILKSSKTTEVLTHHQSLLINKEDHGGKEKYHPSCTPNHKSP